MYHFDDVSFLIGCPTGLSHGITKRRHRNIKKQTRRSIFDRQIHTFDVLFYFIHRKGRQ